MKALISLEFLKLIIVLSASFFVINYSVEGYYYFLYSLCLISPSFLITPFVKRTVAVGLPYEKSLIKIALFSIIINFLIIVIFCFLNDISLDMQSILLFTFLIFFPTFIPLRPYWRIVSTDKNFWKKVRFLILISEILLLIIFMTEFGVGIYILIVGLGAMLEACIHFIFGDQIEVSKDDKELLSNNPIKMLSLVYSLGRFHEAFIRYIFQRQLELIGPIFITLQTVSGSVSSGVEKYFYRPGARNSFSFLIVYSFFFIGTFVALIMFYIDIPSIKRDDLYYQYLWIPFFYVLPFFSTLRSIKILGTNKVSSISLFAMLVSVSSIMIYQSFFELFLGSIVLFLIHPALSLVLNETFIYAHKKKNEHSNN